MSNSVCLMKDCRSTDSSQEAISDCVTWPGCKGSFESDIQAEIIAVSLRGLTFHDANLHIQKGWKMKSIFYIYKSGVKMFRGLIL